jgi:hypothetical protein
MTVNGRRLTLRETQTIVLLIFAEPDLSAGRTLALDRLESLGLGEPQLFAAIEEFQQRLRLTSGQWLGLLRAYPSQVLRSQLHLPALMSDRHIAELMNKD